MHKPNPWIISFESEHKVSIRREESHISSGWIQEVERDGRRAVGSCSLSEDIDIVAVHMDGMGDSRCSRDEDVDPFICGGEGEGIGSV
jgi:hypothetical protein